MKIALDANALVAWASGDGEACARIRSLVAHKGSVVVIPMQAFSEFLVKADDAGSAWISLVEKQRSFTLAPFDRRAAIQCSELDRIALARKTNVATAPQKKKTAPTVDTKQKIKVDRQIVAIAMVASVDLLVTNDRGMLRIAHDCGLNAKSIDELDLPASSRQHELRFNEAQAAPQAPT